MAATVTHTFVSAIADSPTAAAAGEVLPSHWNASHTVSIAHSDLTSGTGTNTHAQIDTALTRLANTSGTNTGDQTLSDATISTTDITTNNVSTTKHGFAPKAPNDVTKFLDGTGAYSVPVTPVLIQIAASDETTALTTGTKVTFRAPYAFTLTSVRGSLTTAQTSGSIFTFNVKQGGSTVFSTTPTIDNTEKTTTTAVTASVISTSAITDDSEITVTIDQIGDGTAKGLKVTLIGTKP